MQFQPGFSTYQEAQGCFQAFQRLCVLGMLRSECPEIGKEFFVDFYGINQVFLVGVWVL